MVINDRISHEWMNEYITKIQSMKTAKPEELLIILDKANQYKYRLIEVLGETEFNNQVKLYTEKYNRLGFLI